MKKNIKSKSFMALMGTLFLGAFNDNAFKIIVSLFALRVLPTAEAHAKFISLIGAVFIIPFVILSPYAGYFADRFRKRNVIVAVKVLEIVIMTIGFFALASQNLIILCGVLMLMTAQSALFGPSKFGILPELLDEEELSQGNGYMQMFTFMAIILGTSVGGILMAITKVHIEYTSFALILFSVIGLGVSLLIEKGEPACVQAKLEKNFAKNFVKYFKEIKAKPALFQVLCAIGYFWFVGSVAQMNILLYSRNILNLSDLMTSALVVALALGIGIGSLMAGKLSEGKIEFGLVPLGSMGISVLTLLLGFGSISVVKVMIYLFLLGIMAGFYVVPLSAFFQYESPAQDRGKYLSVMNVCNALMILAGSAFMWLFASTLSLNPAKIFLMIGLLSVGATICIFKQLPDAFLRFFNWVLTHSLYKIQVIGSENVPHQGGALLVSNHISYIDPSVIMASLQRQVRFLMYRPIYNNKILHPLAETMKAIPVSLNDSPKEIMKSLQEARQAVEAGDLVCIFAEGALSRTGNMLNFNRGFEHIMKDLEAPIIPVNLDSIWGSIFTYERGKYFWKWPKQLLSPITISFGKAMSARSKAYEVRQAVQELGADAFKLRGKYQEKLHMAFIREAKKRPFKLCVADSMGLELNYIKALGMVMLFAKKLFPKGETEIKNEMVGILLPSSAIASLVNGATLMAGKIPVNLNFTASKESLASSIEQCSMKQIITSQKFLDKLGMEKRDDMVLIEDIQKKVTGRERILYVLKALLFPAWLIKLLFVRGDKTHVDDIATIIFSSGSTGEPKGVMLSHGNIFSNIQGFWQVANIKPNDVVMGVLPFFHSFGFTAGLCFPVGTGLTVVYHSNPLDASTIGKMVKKYKASILLGTPTFFSAYTRKCTKEQFESIRYAIAGAEKFQPQMVKAFEEKFGVIPFEGYGATELSPIVALGVHGPDNESEHIKQYGNKLGKVGHPVPGVAAKVVDINTNEILGFDEEGLLLIKGPNVMKGYLNNPEKTAEVLQDGWYVTGDMAMIDRDGFIHVTDRISRFSKIGGEMVPHIKIEEKIMEALGLSERVCAVTSVPDEKKGERLIVLYVGEVDVDQLRSALAENGLPNLWIPRADAFYQIEEIPLLGSGKMDLAKIKQVAKERIIDV